MRSLGMAPMRRSNYPCPCSVSVRRTKFKPAPTTSSRTPSLLFDLDFLPTCQKIKFPSYEFHNKKTSHSL